MSPVTGGFPAFRAFQLDFAAHLRNPRGPRPANVPARPAKLYADLVFARFDGILSACFPVGRQLLGGRWPRLVRAFLRDARCQTPYFHEIPAEFVAWLIAAPPRRLPPWFVELAHYEWTELAVDLADAEVPPGPMRGDPAEIRLDLNPTLLRLAYHWPVHRIGAGYRPRKPRDTQLLVYRDGQDRVRFMEVQPATARLVDLLATGGHTGGSACRAIAAEFPTADGPRVAARALDQLRVLAEAQVVFTATGGPR